MLYARYHEESDSLIGRYLSRVLRGRALDSLVKVNGHVGWNRWIGPTVPDEQSASGADERPEIAVARIQQTSQLTFQPGCTFANGELTGVVIRIAHHHV